MTDQKFDHIFLAPSDFDASCTFYQHGLGWSEVASWGDETTPRGVVLQQGSFQLVMAEAHDASDSSWEGPASTQTPTLHMEVPDADAAYEDLSSRLIPLGPPENTHWGTRWFLTKDPDGNVIAFFSNVSES
tara:strand:+ start:805 stop:1197 length:393 start_codon:yes stop_codon:yes gene_type:complete